jgi:acetyl esterase/lipase
VFAPDRARGGAAPTARPRAAVLLFHGGGWHVGEPAWTYDEARRFARLGLVAVAVQYRLAAPGGAGPDSAGADPRRTTPVDAADDARDAVRWVRAHAGALGADPARVAAWGASAGGHLAASAAFVPAPGAGTVDPRAAPDALVLLSPAVAVAGDGWFRRLVGSPAAAAAASPDAHVGTGGRPRRPPVLILAGVQDSITPAAGARRFCDRARAAGGRCELQLYPGVGHLLSRALAFRAQESGPFDPDPAAVADGAARTSQFLTALGYTR